jgi:hypothetical protein
MTAVTGIAFVIVPRELRFSFINPNQSFPFGARLAYIIESRPNHRSGQDGSITGRGMHIRDLVLGAAAVALSVTSASATMRIADDRGGQIGRYLEAFTTVRSSGERVVIDGNCLSACTLVLGLVPHERICVTHRARFGFHAAWMPDPDGRPVTSPLGTQALWSIYPPSVRRWISTHGGLSGNMIFMQGRDLNGILASCDHDPLRAQARSVRRLTQNPVHESASASSDRR